MKRTNKGLSKSINNILLGLCVMFIFSIIVIGFAAFDCALHWKNLNNNFNWASYITLIVYRISIYFIPGGIVYLIGNNKKRQLKLSIVRAYEIQFISYAIIKLVWDFLALDFIWSIVLFEQINSSVVIIGLLLSLVLGKKTKIDPDIIK